MSNDVVFISKMIEEIKKEEEGALILTCDFQEENLVNIRPSLDNISLSVIYSDPAKFKSMEETTLLSSLVGYLYANNTPVITNDRDLAYHTLFTDDGVQFINGESKIFSYIQKQYSKLIKKNNKREAKKELMLRGIPCTADCFGQYLAKNKRSVRTSKISKSLCSCGGKCDGSSRNRKLCSAVDPTNSGARSLA